MGKFICFMLVLFSFSVFAEEDQVTVERIYNGYTAVNKLYIMKDPKNGNVCYINYNDTGSAAMFCFEKKNK